MLQRFPPSPSCPGSNPTVSKSEAILNKIHTLPTPSPENLLESSNVYLKNKFPFCVRSKNYLSLIRYNTQNVYNETNLSFNIRYFLPMDHNIVEYNRCLNYEREYWYEGQNQHL